MRTFTRSTLLTVGLAALAIGCGGSDTASDADGDSYTVELAADEYSFVADEAIEIRAGDTVTFAVRNIGVIDHKLEVLTSESRSLGATGRISPGDSESITVTFEQDGVYRVICDIDDHLSRGQQAVFEVAPAATS